LKERIEKVKHMAREIRKESLTMIHAAQSGHPGGSLSEADILAALYFDIMNIRPEEPHWEDRDRFVLSKGHACPAFYAALALRGFYDKAKLSTLRKFGSGLQGHPVKGKLPGIEITTGSLGQGLSVAAGMALAAKRDKKNINIYVVLGDGECNEGQVWEAAMTASKYGLSNLCAIIDHNGLQNDDTTAVIQPITNFQERFSSFGWDTVVIDGHDVEQILLALDKSKKQVEKPLCIIARTVKGKGVSFMENVVDWHGTAPNDDEYIRAMQELEVM
jgi:transketolase